MIQVKNKQTKKNIVKNVFFLINPQRTMLNHTPYMTEAWKLLSNEKRTQQQTEQVETSTKIQ